MWSNQLSAGSVRGFFAAADCGAARFDAGRNRHGDAQAPDRRSRSGVWRFFKRHDIRFKKPAGGPVFFIRA
jgi:hypothetical protein